MLLSFTDKLRLTLTHNNSTNFAAVPFVEVKMLRHGLSCKIVPQKAPQRKNAKERRGVPWAWEENRQGGMGGAWMPMIFRVAVTTEGHLQRTALNSEHKVALTTKPGQVPMPGALLRGEGGALAR